MSLASPSNSLRGQEPPSELIRFPATFSQQRSLERVIIDGFPLLISLHAWRFFTYTRARAHTPGTAIRILNERKPLTRYSFNLHKFLLDYHFSHYNLTYFAPPIPLCKPFIFAATYSPTLPLLLILAQVTTVPKITNANLRFFQRSHAAVFLSVDV